MHLLQAEGQVSPRYIGESSRTKFERGLEHATDCRDLSKLSHMRDHVQNSHQELLGQLLRSPAELFSMQLIKPARSALSRQIREAVEIAKNSKGGTLLNSK